ncbi:hypothetical protein PMZ80_003435 [Knufia obscura]|uniref:Uncharacterized protein n=1 Tax=Knufia obscura TaxID=1635080 RepID=A0ABR0RVT7_9EURO|nr:hypothetical protein PMZ80_003435 [Knufia obscura]
MLPPPPTATLEANPNFANLYNHLTEHILAHDGSTLSKSKEYEEVTVRLNEARQLGAREEILLRALEEVALHGSEDQPESRLPRPVTSVPPVHQTYDALTLPPELRELIYNVTSYLSASLDPNTSQTLPTDTDELMADELEQFRQHLPTISQALSAHLVDTESSLAATARSLSPTTSASKPPSRSNSRPENTTLSSTLKSLQHSTHTTQHTSLPQTLNTTTSSLSSSSAQHTSTLHHQIRHLELTTHGTSSRHTTSRATYLSTVSRGIALKAQIMGLEREKTLYANQEIMDRLESEGDALEVEERKLLRRERELRGLLGEYEREGGLAAGRVGVGGAGRRGKEEGTGEDVFRALGERYAEVEREIERLETKVWRGR